MKKLLATTLFLLTIISYSEAAFKVIGYLPTYRWSYINTTDFTQITHVMASFANPKNTAGELTFGQNLATLKTKADANNVEVFISIGGGGLNATMISRYETLMEPANRPGFINQLMNFVRDNDLDGIDVDLEGSLVQDANYNGFVIELADSLHNNSKEISAAITRWNTGGLTTAVYDAFDFINIMCYDKTGSWTWDEPGQHAPMSLFTDFFSHWKNNKNVNPNKIIMGVPFYGYEFTGTTNVPAWTWCQIVNEASFAAQDPLNSDQVTTGNGTLYYNGIPTIQQKTKYVADNNGGGIMIWELGHDCSGSNSMLQVIYDELADNGINVSVDEVLSDNSEITLFPNPTTSNFSYTSSVMPQNIAIYDITGKMVEIENNINSKTVNFALDNAGLYFVRSTFEDGSTKTSKVLVK